MQIGQFAIELDSGIGDIAEGIELIANANSIVNAIETIIEDYKDHDPQTCPKDGSALGAHLPCHNLARVAKLTGVACVSAGTVLLDLTGLWQQTKEDKEREAKEKAIQEVTAAPAP